MYTCNNKRTYQKSHCTHESTPSLRQREPPKDAAGTSCSAFLCAPACQHQQSQHTHRTTSNTVDCNIARVQTLVTPPPPANEQMDAALAAVRSAADAQSPPNGTVLHNPYTIQMTCRVSNDNQRQQLQQVSTAHTNVLNYYWVLQRRSRASASHFVQHWTTRMQPGTTHKECYQLAFSDGTTPSIALRLERSSYITAGLAYAHTCLTQSSRRLTTAARVLLHVCYDAAEVPASTANTVLCIGQLPHCTSTMS
jgi:hypothetical protein